MIIVNIVSINAKKVNFINKILIIAQGLFNCCV